MGMAAAWPTGFSLMGLPVVSWATTTRTGPARETTSRFVWEQRRLRPRPIQQPLHPATPPRDTGERRPRLRRAARPPGRRLRRLRFRRLGFRMAGPGDVEGVTASMGELRVELEASSSRETEIALHENGDDVAAAEEDDDIWGDASDSPGHESTLDREWIHRQNQFHKMGYRDGITEGQKDSAQEGFNVGFRQSVHVGYKWGLVRGVTSALASLPDSLKEKLLPDVQCRGKLQDLHDSAQEISAGDALQMFHDSIRQNNHTSGEPLVTSEEDGATDSNRLKSLSKDLVLLLHECPGIKVSEELA
ncbi:uncharacterized protein LOC133928402 [Phragmites australis]|uniref:uncharacterized protein LOC133928402 n=1 Tax=Phragmites australis TaxID=29695 RepID=UPI002D766A8B|nr:uncharacterized protein LOC133928402 [Phragmites australis]